MIKNIALFTAILGLIMAWTSALQARFGAIDAEAIKSPVVVELFTSQSCSSCPPADKLFSELAQNPNVIALGFHVTYWDHLSWKDTLGQTFATDRQRSYSRQNRTNKTYTPQMIVNGANEFVGSNTGKLNAALKSEQPIAPIEIDKMADNVAKIHLPALKNDGALNYTVRIFGVKNQTPVEIQRGENRGKSVNYHNAVVFEQSLGSWLGKAEDKIVTLPVDSNIDHFVILAQSGGFGQIVAAGKADL